MAKSKTVIEQQERLNSEIPKSLDELLISYTQRKRISKKAVVEQALRRFLDPATDNNRDAMIARRLQRIDQKLLALVESNKVVSESLGVWIQICLGLMPEPVTESEKTEFADKVKRRWPRYIDTLTEILAERSRGLYSYLPKQMVVQPSDFSLSSELDTDKNPNEGINNGS